MTPSFAPRHLFEQRPTFVEAIRHALPPLPGARGDDPLAGDDVEARRVVDASWSLGAERSVRHELPPGAIEEGFPFERSRRVLLPEQARAFRHTALSEG